MSLSDPGAVLTGRVATFDDAAGWGVVAAESGAVYPFHCTAIVGGTRTVEAGTPVVFQLAPGHRGEWEAAGVTPR